MGSLPAERLNLFVAGCKRLARTFFGGSLPQMITELAAEESWTEAELDAMQDEINRARKESAHAKTRKKQS